jgi:4-amino-4-deoxy-L-arabinose transferase-like glycosyltransferase
LAIGGVVALALLLVGELAPGRLPVHVGLEVRGSTGQVAMDGGQHDVQVPELPAGARIRFEEPGPVQREYQIDGSDTTARDDRDPDQIRAEQNTPWYRVMSWLRDEASYSRWQDVRLVDLSDGHVIASGRDAVEASPLPNAFGLEADLRRPEAPARIRLEKPDGSKLAGLSVERESHRALWQVGDNDTKATAWFFPNEAWPFAAELLELVGRSAAAAMVLLGTMAAIGWVAWRVSRRTPHPLDRTSPRGRGSLPPTWVIAGMVLVVWLTAALFVTVRLYHQLPHIVDAQAYYFQARIFEAGRTWLQIPSIVSQLDGFQQVEWDSRWFGQYPPGAPALYALGGLVGLAWLVGPLATLALLVGTATAGWLMYDRGVALTALVLLAISPFVLFQAGSFMSHPISGGAVACSLAAFAYGQRTNRGVAYAAAGALLGLAFNAREVAAVLYGLPYAAWLLAERRWRGLIWMGAAAVPFLAIYLLFNWSTTGNPLVLPRNLFSPNDRWGFGDVGPSGHTLAAGLENTDENLTLLQFDLFGWPPLAALALIGMPFLLGRANRFDALLAVCGGGFVVAYVGYFYSGVALGPRYYFEAVPALALLAARGLQTSVQTLHELGLSRGVARLGIGVVVALLCVWTFGYYLPHAIDRRMDFGAIGGGRRLVMPFVKTTLGGPQLAGVDPPALVLVSDGDVFKSLSGLNCPLLDDAHLDQCPVLLVDSNVADAQKDLYARFPGRSVWLIDRQGDLVTLQRVRNST